MSDIREWIERKLQEEGYSTTRLGSRHLEVTRSNHRKSQVFCVALADNENFDAEDVDATIEQDSGVSFIVVIPTRITHEAYERAEQRGVCVAGFGELRHALAYDDDITRHIDSQEQYERRRLAHNAAVESVHRKGHHAYEIRRKELRPLTIVTTNDYEFTVDRLYSILEEYHHLILDLIVVTNPNCRGFSTASMSAAAQSGVPLVRFVDFLNRLGTGWK